MVVSLDLLGPVGFRGLGLVFVIFLAEDSCSISTHASCLHDSSEEAVLSVPPRSLSDDTFPRHRKELFSSPLEAALGESWLLWRGGLSPGCLPCPWPGASLPA